jgi:hypothetical protein
MDFLAQRNVPEDKNLVELRCKNLHMYIYVHDKPAQVAVKVYKDKLMQYVAKLTLHICSGGTGVFLILFKYLDSFPWDSALLQIFLRCSARAANWVNQLFYLWFAKLTRPLALRSFLCSGLNRV